MLHYNSNKLHVRKKGNLNHDTAFIYDILLHTRKHCQFYGAFTIYGSK